MRLLVAEGGREHVGALRDVLRGLAGEAGPRGPVFGVSMTGGTFDFSPSGGAFSSDSLGWLLGLVLPLGDGWAVGASAGVCGYDAGYLGVDFEGGAFFADAALLYDAGRLHQVLSLGVGSFGVDTRRDVAVRAHGYDMEGGVRGRLSALSLNVGYEGSYDVLVSSDGLSRLSPVLLADVVLGRFDEMSESGLGRAGLRSRCDDVCYVTLGTGLRYVHGFGASGGFVGLEGLEGLEGLLLGSMGDVSLSVRNGFLGGGPQMELTGPRVGGVGLRVGGNSRVPLSARWSLLGSAGADFREHRRAVSATLGVSRVLRVLVVSCGGAGPCWCPVLLRRWSAAAGWSLQRWRSGLLLLRRGCGSGVGCCGCGGAARLAAVEAAGDVKSPGRCSAGA